MKRLLISLSSLVAFGAAAHAQPAPDPAAAPPVAPTEPAPVVAEPPPPVEPPKPAKVEDPRRFAIGKESPGAYLQLGLNLQVWYFQDFASKTAADGSDDMVSTASSFRTRRLELSASGEIVPKLVRYRFMYDLARVRDFLGTTNVNGVTVTTGSGNTSGLQDMWLTLVTEYADISFGQSKNMISWDGFNSAAKIIMPDRQFVALLVGGQRDVGIRVEKTFKKFMYAAALFNGAGQNTLDNNNQKDISGRLEVYPVPGMTIAGAFYDSIGYRTKRGTKDRWEGDFRYETGPYLIQSEFIYNRDVTADDAPKPLKSYGGYVALAYNLKGALAGHDLQPVVRVGYFDPNADLDLDPAPAAGTPAQAFLGAGNTDERYDYEVGLNYYLRGHETKFQISYDRQQFQDSDKKKANNEIILASQVWF